MTPEQTARARRILANFLPEGRNAPRDQITRAKISHDLGRNRTYLGDFINERKASLGAAEVSKIEKMLNLPRGWLLDGEGDVPHPEYKVPNHPLADRVSPIQTFEQFEADTKALMRGDTPATAEPGPYTPEPNATIVPGPAYLPATALLPNDIPELGVTVGGIGDDDSVFELNGGTVDYHPRPPGLARRPNVFVLRVANSSMVPRFEDGDIEYIELKNPSVGEYVVVELKPTGEDGAGRSYIKKLVKSDARKIVVEQFNPPGFMEFGRNEIRRLFRVITNKKELIG